MQKRGFTLIELLVVIAIIGILVTIVLVGFGTIRQDAKNANIKGNMAQMRLAVEMFYNDNTTYTGASAETSYGAALSSAEDQLPSGTTCLANGGHFSDTEFCLECPMVGGGFWCVDSDGYMGEIAASACDGTDFDCQP